LAIIAPSSLAGVDQDAALGRIFAAIDPALLGDGPVTITVRATDGAGFEKTSSVDVTVDTLVPSVTFSTPAPGLLTSSGSLTVTGVAIDAMSEVVAVEVEVSGTVFAATLAGAPKSKTFSAAVALTASPCGPAWSGANVIRVRARDAAEHWSLYAMTQVTYDNCDPVVTVAPNTILDEGIGKIKRGQGKLRRNGQVLGYRHAERNVGGTSAERR
jgi:hypothetical protein